MFNVTTTTTTTTLRTTTTKTNNSRISLYNIAWRLLIPSPPVVRLIRWTLSSTRWLWKACRERSRSGSGASTFATHRSFCGWYGQSLTCFCTSETIFDAQCFPDFEPDFGCHHHLGEMVRISTHVRFPKRSAAIIVALVLRRVVARGGFRVLARTRIAFAYKCSYLYAVSEG